MIKCPIFQTDPVPDEANEGHYQKFSDAFGAETTEIHLPSAKCKEQKNTMSFAHLNIRQISVQNVISHGLFTLITCLIPIEKLYYSAGCDACYCHRGSKRKLITDFNCYPICSLCKRSNKKQIAKPTTIKLKQKQFASTKKFSFYVADILLY